MLRIRKKIGLTFAACTLLSSLVTVTALPALAVEVRSFNLTEGGGYIYDAASEGREKTAAQNAVDYMYSLGVRHVILNTVARMSSVTASDIVPATKIGIERTRERDRYSRLIKYIHSKGMTVGLRPIILVEKVQGASSTPVSSKDLWHGNIKPQDPLAWFNSLRTYLGIYVNIAKMAGVEEFTVGAELYSMTVGLEDQWKEQPYGFPREWTQMIRDLKAKLGNSTRIMYDINYTDQTANNDGTGPSGGEIERWRYRLVDLKPKPGEPESASTQAWHQLKEFWAEVDVIGIDIYRSLVSSHDEVPGDYDALVSKLQIRAEEFASDLDSKLLEIEQATGVKKRIILKETGFKSCTGSFLNPFEYDNPNKTVNISHQAAAYQAMFNAFVAPEWPWLQGIAFWDISVDPARSGVNDPGFSPRGKAQTEDVIRNGWGK